MKQLQNIQRFYSYMKKSIIAVRKLFFLSLKESKWKKIHSFSGHFELIKYRIFKIVSNNSLYSSYRKELSPENPHCLHCLYSSSVWISRLELILTVNVLKNDRWIGRAMRSMHLNMFAVETEHSYNFITYESLMTISKSFGEIFS